MAFALYGLLTKPFSFYRTDSETTDDQCIPESLSERSAVDSPPVEDSDPDTAVVLPQEEGGVAQQRSPLSPPDEALELRESESQHGAHLDVRDSSTESDKTVLSMTTVTAAQDGGRVPETPPLNKLGILGLPLPVPQIVVEEYPDSPSSPLVDQIEELARVEQAPQCRQSRKTTPTPLVRIPKAFSVPNASSACEASTFAYEQLEDNPSSSPPPLATASAFSSRSESPLSERGSTSLLHLNATQRLTRSDLSLDFKKSHEKGDALKGAKAAGDSASVSAASRSGPKKKRLKKRSELNKSLVQLEEITKGSKGEISVESLAPTSSKSKSKKRSKLRQQLKLQGGVKSTVHSSSSSDSIHSHM